MRNTAATSAALTSSVVLLVLCVLWAIAAG
jgi:hypothetical protein